MKTSEIKELTDKELRERLDAEQNHLSRMKMNHAVSPVENPTLIKKARRDIARMLTILGQKETVKA